MSKILTNHEEVKQWIEERNGVPAAVTSTMGQGHVGIIRIAFPKDGEIRKGLTQISWGDFFEALDRKSVV